MKPSKVFLIAALSITAFAVKSEVLYWQVQPEDGISFSWANLQVVNTSDHSPVATAASEVYAADLGSGDTGSYTTMQQTDISSWNSNDYSFFVELVTYSEGGNTSQNMYTWSYNELVSAGYVASSSLDAATARANASTANLGSATPEPTSGMLLLIGGSLLALRRRRRQA